MKDRERQRFIDRVWREKGRKYGFSCPPLLRRLVDPDRYFMGYQDDDMEQEDFAGAVDEFFSTQLPIILRFAAESASALASQPADKADGQSSDKRVYQKCFERRLRIFAFVAERALPPLGVLGGDFSIAPKRMPWRQLCAQWNKAYPHDPMTPELLRVAYWRAKQAGLGEVYRRRQLQDLADMLAALPSFVRHPEIMSQMRHRRTGLSLEQLQREVERLTPAARAEQRRVTPTGTAKSRR